MLFCLFNGASTLSWNILDLLTTEMFPTTIRSFVMGFLSSLGRISAAVAQLQFSAYGAATSLPICATSLALAALASLALPNLSHTGLADL
jgi:VNT family MFS transporter (synaptic vesicle glycoprotein 2)